jgi:hypothetical protein
MMDELGGRKLAPLNRKEDQPTQSIAIARRRLFWAHQVYIG